MEKSTNDIWVTLSVAKLAKKKAFNLECDLFYSEDDNELHEGYCCNITENISVPNTALLHSWLRKEHSLYVIVDFNILGPIGFMTSVLFLDENGEYHVMKTEFINEVFEDYDKAMMSGIEGALELIN